MLKDSQIPSKEFEKLIYNYLNKNYTKEQDTNYIACSLYFKFSNNKVYRNYPSCVFLAMVEWWKVGFYDLYFNRDKTIEKDVVQWNLILKELRK